jgi:hypothetical protein
MTTSRTYVLSALACLTLAGCGPVPDGTEGDELAPGEVETVQQAATVLDNCATGDDPNAIGFLGNSDGYTRSAGFANPGICNPARATTIVDFRGVSNTRYRFNMTASFPFADTWLECLTSRVAMRTLKSNGTEVNYQEAVPTWSNGQCFGGVAYILKSTDHSADGDYRVRARATRHDGKFETVSIIGAYWN